MSDSSNNVIISQTNIDDDNLVEIKQKHIKSLLIQGNTYFDILLYNCYDETRCVIDKTKLSEAFDDLIDNYSNLFDFGISLSGYQFVGIILENNLSTTESLHVRTAYFILSVGFLISMFGVLICFITIEFLRGCREEHPEFIIAGINKYKTLFKLGDIILYANCILFTVPINILIYSSLDYYFGIIYNVLCGILFILGMYFHYIIIVARQQYNVTDQDITKIETFNTDIFAYLNHSTDNRYTYQRKLFARQNKKD